MNLLYDAAMSLMGPGARLAAGRSPKMRLMRNGQKQTWKRLEDFRKELAPNGFDVWFHVASLGEFEQARPLIDALIEARPNISILLSFFSPSGYEVRHNYHPRVGVVYLPFDTPSNASRFLMLAAPKQVVFVKYEFWGNYLSQIARRGIPLYLISAIFRPSQIFFRPWGGTFRKMLTNFDRIYVQDEGSRDLLSKIGIDRVVVAGDTRFDRVTDIRKAARVIPEIEDFISRIPKDAQIVVFGSSWESDEVYYIPWLKKHPEVYAIIAPHEFDKKRLIKLSERLGDERTELLSQYDSHGKLPHYILVDCFGLLSSLYRYASLAYVGGGFGVSIHNINEAAVYGIPVVFGPRHDKFKEAADLIHCGGGFSASSGEELEQILTSLITDVSARTAAGQASRHYIDTHTGASPLILKEVFNFKPNSPLP
ncbi:MAG: 3-deoxy-D-manno-octulosonic acid transferase [Bacteroidales bacterium]|nr:3-deoxy-D-manno-octulosonic acid transferase [Bacteroidales bacterium]